jgi:hypothetical protein
MSSLGVFGSRAMLSLLATGGEERERRAVEEPATVETGDVQPSPRASFSAADREEAADSVDAVAGSEFVDDRIRLQE